MQVTMVYVSVSAVVVFAVAEVGAWRRKHRRDVDHVGFMPWREVAIAALVVAFFGAALAMHGG